MGRCIMQSYSESGKLQNHADKAKIIRISILGTENQCGKTNGGGESLFRGGPIKETTVSLHLGAVL